MEKPSSVITYSEFRLFEISSVFKGHVLIHRFTSKIETIKKNKYNMGYNEITSIPDNIKCSAHDSWTLYR